MGLYFPADIRIPNGPSLNQVHAPLEELLQSFDKAKVGVGISACRQRLELD
jgi:hypothetical protein